MESKMQSQYDGLNHMQQEIFDQGREEALKEVLPVLEEIKEQCRYNCLTRGERIALEAIEKIKKELEE